MKDSFQRTINYMRISVTDRCNFRCIYCMPEEGVAMKHHADILRYDEITRICRIMAELGLRKIKLTGGEPLVRKGLPGLIRDLKEIPKIESVTLTTNGDLLADQIGALCAAGLDGVNISIDTLDPALFAKITRIGTLDAVKKGIEAAAAQPGLTVKLNCVPLRMVGPGVLDLAEYARDRDIHVRYIEMMPIGPGGSLDSYSDQELREMMRERFGEPEPVSLYEGNGPASYYALPGFRGRIGMISALSHPFCDTCNRVRLTSEGFLKTCLQYEEGGDLRELLRGGASDEDLRERIRLLILQKPRRHHFADAQEPGAHDRNQNRHLMSQVGG